MKKNNKVTKKTILENFPEEEFIFMDGFDEAIIGVDCKTSVVVYSMSLILNTLITVNKFKLQDAMDHFYFEINANDIGEKTPIIVDDYNFFR